MWALICLALVAALPETPLQQFARAWEHQNVVVKRALYTLVYDERGKLGNTYEGKRDGLTVVTPTGVLLQFDGRQGRSEVVCANAEDVVGAVRTQYNPDALDLRSYRKLNPIVVHRYDPGVELVVLTARVSRDTIRFGLALPGQDVEATSLTVRWTTPFSKTFSEREIVEGLLGWFVERPSTSAAR
jgi:hypothetical protein